MALGRVLKNIRVARGLSREEVTGDQYSVSHLAAVEQEVKRPSVKMLTHVADQLRVSLEMLVPEVMEKRLPVPEKIRLARALCREDKYDLALQILDEADEDDLRAGEAYRVDRLEARAFIELQRGNCDEALDMYGQVASIRERGGNGLLVAKAYHGKGLSERSLGRWDRANHWFFLAWERLSPMKEEDPGFTVELLQDYGDSLSHVGQFEAARCVYEHLRSVSGPDDVSPLFSLGCCAEEMGDHEAAAEYFRAAACTAERTMGSDPQYMGQILIRLGANLRRIGDAEGAAGHLVQALDSLDGGARVTAISELLECLLDDSGPDLETAPTWIEDVDSGLLDEASDYEKTRHLLVRARVLERRNEPREALMAIREALAIVPHNECGLHREILSLILRLVCSLDSTDSVQWALCMLQTSAD